jgi:hypothetical protein
LKRLRRALPCPPALEAMYSVHHEMDHGIEELLGGFRIKAADEFRRIFEIRKEHRDLLALTCEGGASSDDLEGSRASCPITHYCF